MMNYPSFFTNVEKIQMQDPLSDVLGSFQGGLIEYSFVDIVKYTGHGCPTVAGAYMVCLHALKALYEEGEMPMRGEIEVYLRAQEDEGANGVIGNVFTFILGASGPGGFKGLGGKFSRHGLIHYGINQKAQFLFKRKDNQKEVYVDYHPEFVAGDPRTSLLIKKIISNESTSEEKELLHSIWNARVKELLIDQSQDRKIYALQ